MNSISVGGSACSAIQALKRALIHCPLHLLSIAAVVSSEPPIPHVEVLLVPPRSPPTSKPAALGTNSSNTTGGGAPQPLYARKIFVGGLPLDVCQATIEREFAQFGALHADWPPNRKGRLIDCRLSNSSHSGGACGGYVFLVYDAAESVRALVAACRAAADGTYWLLVNSPTMRNKPVQVRPWRVADAIYYTDASAPVSLRTTVFIGGVPRPVRAVDLARLMNAEFGGVVFASIDVDPDLHYPKGAARVVFDNEQSCQRALQARYIDISRAQRYASGEEVSQSRHTASLRCRTRPDCSWAARRSSRWR